MCNWTGKQTFSFKHKRRRTLWSKDTSKRDWYVPISSLYPVCSIPQHFSTLSAICAWDHQWIEMKVRKYPTALLAPMSHNAAALEKHLRPEHSSRIGHVNVCSAPCLTFQCWIWACYYTTIIQLDSIPEPVKLCLEKGLGEKKKILQEMFSAERNPHVEWRSG